MRSWALYIFENARWAPMVSLGIHVDFHTPRAELHLPLITVSVGRIGWAGRFRYFRGERWNGHTDDCDHPRTDP